MKKVLSIVLSICLLVTSLSAVLTQSVSANTYDFEDINNWGIYKFGTHTSFDGTAVGPNSGFPSIALNKTANLCFNNTGKSIKLYGNTTNNAVRLPSLEANTQYTLSFKYMIPADATWGSSKAWFVPSIYKLGADIDAKNPTTYFARGTAPSTPTSPSDGNWYDYNLEFTTDNTTEYFATIYSTLGGNPYNIYVDEFELIKGETYTPVTISFDSNGGSQVESVVGNAGGPITMPTNPTKEGFVFAGWYTDKALTNQFLGKIAPETDVTLYAKWVYGAYQDFEGYSLGKNSKVEVVQDSSVSYSGSGAIKFTTQDAKVSEAYTVLHNNKLSEFASYGEQVTVSFRYKLVSGAANVYLRTSTKSNSASLPQHKYTKEDSSTGTDYTNAFSYYSKELGTVSEDWQTYTCTYTICTEEEYAQKYHGATNLDQAFGYAMFSFSSSTPNTELYIDDVAIYKTVNIPIQYSTETVRIETVDSRASLTSATFGDSISFKAVSDSSITATVSYGSKVLTPVDGVYTIDSVNDTDVITVTATGMSDAQNHAPGVGLNGEDLTKYDADLFLENIWEGDTIYHESVMFTDSLDGTKQLEKKLLYPIDDIISVRNDDLNKWYVKGVDFDVKDGKLCWLEGGQCPIWTGHLIVPTDSDDPYYDEALDYGGFNSASAYYTLEPNGDKGLYLMADAKHEDATVYVTYKHSKTWDEVGETGYTPAVPKNQSDDMKPFYDKLATTEDVNVLVYGASTATGCGATGGFLTYELFSEEPDPVTGEYTVTERKAKGGGKSAPTFFEQATAKLVRDYGNNNKINYYNIAHGGTGAKWGAEQLQNRVAAMNKYYGKTIVPDIIYIKFAGNDVRTTPEKYREYLTSMTEQFQTLYPNAIVVLLSGKINNEKCYIFGDYHQNVLNQEQVVFDIAASKKNCVAAATTSVWAEIVESKDYEDYLSNNINHANDFWAKTTAQIIVGSLAKTENHEHIYDNYLDPDCNSCGDVREITFTGWHQDNNGTWYYYENGNMVKNDWRQDSVGWVYLGSSGAMLTNAWCTDSQGWCYVGADGYAVTNCWKKDSIGWCYLGANGSQVKNNWVLDGGKWYFINANGYMVSNCWKQDSKGWVYLGASGAMLTNAWCTDSQGWCYVGADGYAVTNCWKKDSIGWCYLGANGSQVKNNWVLDGGKWYYLDANGYMLSNTSRYIKNKTYYFNASGVCTNP